MKTYTILLAQDAPCYGFAQIEANTHDEAILTAKALDPGEFCDDIDFKNPICRRIVHVEAPDGQIIATDISLDHWIVALVPDHPPKALPRFNHALDIAFSVETHDADGGDATPAAIRRALYERIAALNDDELMEAVGAPYDSYELEPRPEGETV